MLETAGLKGLTESVNLVFDTQGTPGALLAAGGAVDQSESYVFAVVPRGVQPSASKSLSYWSIGNGDDTMVTIWNPADEPQDFIFQLNYQGGHCGYPIHLGPKATKMFNISQTVNSQTPDSKGNVIPLSVTEGSAVLMGSQGEVQHVLAAMDSAIYNVQKATCGTYLCETCDGVASASIFDDPWAAVVNGTHRLTFYETYNSGNQYDTTGQGRWSSTATNIATVNSGWVSGVSVGSATMDVVDSVTEPGYSNECGYYLPSCPIYYYDPSVESAGSVGPSITSISPAQGLVGTAISITMAGTGFASGDTVSAGSKITVSNVSVVSSTQITATFTPSNSTSAGGSQGVTVTASGQTSDSQNFYVQLPTYFVTTSAPHIANPGFCGSAPGYFLSLNNFAADQNGNQISAAGITPQESENGGPMTTAGYATPATTGS